MERIVMHIDVNSAFLSWSAVDLLNKGKKQDIRTVPSIVGYENSKRHGITLAASVPAKKIGIRVPEPIYMAKKKCSNLIIVEPDYKLYEEMSKKFHDIVSSYTPDYEKFSIDECFIEYGPISKLYKFKDPIEFANMLREEIYNKCGFTVNIGIGNNKLLAKMASDFEKPNKVHTLYMGEIENKMHPLPIRELFGCGKKTCEMLNKIGITTIGDLAKLDKEYLYRRYKNIGLDFYDKAHGIDNSKVGKYEAKDESISKEVTLLYDVNNREELCDELKKLARDVSFELRERNKYASVVSVYLKSSDFNTVRKQKKYNNQFRTEDEVYNNARELLNILYDGSDIRLIGLKLSSFSDKLQTQISMFDDAKDKKEKRSDLQNIIDDINKKYGKGTINKSSLKKKN